MQPREPRADIHTAVFAGGNLPLAMSKCVFAPAG